MKSLILLVDDNPVQCAARKAILERTGCDVLCTPNGETALEILSGGLGGEQVGLLLTDHLMPEMSGLELVRAARRLGHKLPVIVLSGLPDAESDYNGLDITFRAKPFPPDSLIALAHSLLRDSLPKTA